MSVTGTQGPWVLLAAVLGSGIVFLDSTIVTVALPQIGEDLPSSLVGVLEGQSYVYYGYLLMAPPCQDTRLQDDEIRGARQGSRWCHGRLGPPARNR